jgi:predicted small metal-binding protein
MISMKALACRNAGFNCDVVIRGDTEEEIMANTAEHAIEEHMRSLITTAC